MNVNVDVDEPVYVYVDVNGDVDENVHVTVSRARPRRRTRTRNRTRPRARARSRSLISGALLVAAVAGCGVTPAEPPREPLPVPFAVSDHYSPDGFFGDGETRGAVDLTKECPPRAPGATGDCYTVTYRPGAKGFAGVVWQYPHNNWGFWPGHAIAPGAARITLQARGGRGGETITFGGGQRDSPNPHRDIFKLDEVTVGLQPHWTRHEIPFGGESYLGPSGVIGAFLFSLAAGTGREPIVIHLDDIRWTP